MARESRRYFKCTAELPALLRRANAGADLKCATINISSNGMALRTPSPLCPGEVVQITLPGGEQPIAATGTVVWDDRHGKTGTNFQCIVQRDQFALDAWLHAGFGEKEEALSWLEKGYEERAAWIVYLNTDPRYDNLRSEPRFQELLRRMKFPT